MAVRESQNKMDGESERRIRSLEERVAALEAGLNSLMEVTLPSDFIEKLDRLLGNGRQEQI